MELSADIVRSRFDKIAQHVIRIGRTNQFAHGKSHFAGIIPRQNIAEISARHHKIHFVAVFNLFGRQQIAVRRKVIGNLRRESSEIDGVRARQFNTPAEQFGF